MAGLDEGLEEEVEEGMRAVDISGFDPVSQGPVQNPEEFRVQWVQWVQWVQQTQGPGSSWDGLRRGVQSQHVWMHTFFPAVVVVRKFLQQFFFELPI